MQIFLMLLGLTLFLTLLGTAHANQKLSSVDSRGSLQQGNGVINKKLAGFIPKLLGPMDDPLDLADAFFEFDKMDTFLISGWLEMKNALVLGLSSINDSLILDLMGLIITGDIFVERIIFQSDLNTDAVLNFQDSGSRMDLHARDGHFKVTMEEFRASQIFAKIHVDLTNDCFSISNLNATFHFDGPIEMTGQQILYDNELVDWSLVKESMPTFVGEIQTIYKEEVLLAITEMVNIVLKDIKISDIIAEIG